jgi:hypothetical protein
MTCGAGLLALAAAASAATSATPTPPSLDFDRTFATPEDRRQVNWTAVYEAGGTEHTIEVWRDAESRLRRRTDGKLETYLTRAPGSIEWSMSVLDLQRKIRTDIDRTNLLRIGHQADWFSAAHALVRPRGAYRLVAVPEPAGAKPIASCRWYALSQADRRTTICWDAKARVPLLIEGDDDKAGAHRVLWRVTKVTTGALPAGIFVIDDRGFVRNDANADIAAD